MSSEVLRAGLCGLVVSTLWMFPLLNGLSSSPVWLHWTAFDSAETLVAWVLAGALVATTFLLPVRLEMRTLRDTIGAAWLLTGGLFVIGAVSKFGPVHGVLGSYRPWALAVIVPVVLLLAAVAVGVIVRPGPGSASRLERFMCMLWPLCVLFAFHLVHAPSLAARQRSVSSQSISGRVALPAARRASGPQAPRTVVLLFDEMSPDYLYGAHAIDTSALPALHRLLAEGQIHRDAHLPGGGTALAIPALFGATPTAPAGLVNALLEQGRSVRVWGWYHDYCSGMASGADICRSTSIYNARTLHEGFSVLDPWWTDFNLLPAERPFDLLKNRFAVAMHRRTLAAARAWLVDELADPAADFIYVHVNAPHAPLFTEHPERLSDPRPFVLSADGYVTQFSAVEAVVGTVLASGTRPTRLIVLSDHNVRPLTPQALHDHVAFVVLQPGLSAGNVLAREAAADLVARLSLQPGP